MTKSIFLDIHGIRLKILSDTTSSVDAIRRNFGYFITTGKRYDYVIHEEQLRYLFSSDKWGVTGALLHHLSILLNSDYLFFHGSCVAKNGKALAFIGPSFSGKTTLALMCVKQGFEILSDDVVMIRKDDFSVMPFPMSFTVRNESRGFLDQVGIPYGDKVDGNYTDIASLTRVFLIGKNRGLTPPLYMLKNSFLGSRGLSRRYLADIMRLLKVVDAPFAKELTLTRYRSKELVYNLLRNKWER